MLTLVFVICNTINIFIISIAMFYPDYFNGGSTKATAKQDVNDINMKPPKLRKKFDDPVISMKNKSASGSKTSIITETDDDVIIRFYRTMFAVQQVLPLLNSTVSPMILIWRGSALKNFFKSMFSKQPSSSSSSLVNRLTVARSEHKK